MKNYIALLVAITLFCSYYVHGQTNKSDKPLYVGLHGGVNYTLSKPDIGSSVFSSVEDGEEGINTSSGTFFNKIGYQFGINITKFIFTDFALDFTPEQFTTRNTILLTETIDGNSSFNINRTLSTNTQYYRFPLSLMYWKRNTKIQPFAYAGISYGLLSQSTAVISEEIENIQPGLPTRTTTNTTSTEINALFIKSRFDLIGGIGVMYDLSRLLIGIDANFSFLLNNIGSSQNRFQNAGTIFSPATKSHIPALQLRLLLNIESSDSGKKGLDCIYFPAKKFRK